METKHTKGTWLIEECPSQLESTITSTNGKRICVVKSYPSRLFNDPDVNERIANEKLIAVAPDSLKAVIESYLFNLVYMENKIRFTVHGQSILVNQLNAIAHATGINAKEIHDEFESLEYDVKSGNITFEEAIKKATE